MFSFGGFGSELKSLNPRALLASSSSLQAIPSCFSSSHIGYLSVSQTALPPTSPSGLWHRDAPFTAHDSPPYPIPQHTKFSVF